MTQQPDPQETANRCTDCRHWRFFAPPGPGFAVARGKCLRFPPLLATGYNPATDPAYWVWPVCAADSTCGEWTAKGATPPATQYAFDQGAFA